MKIGVAEIAIAGGLAWLLFGRGGKAAQAVVERPAPAPQPSPAYETPGITPPVIPAPLNTAARVTRPGTGLTVSVTPVANALQQRAAANIRVIFSNDSDGLLTIFRGLFALRDKSNNTIISYFFAKGEDSQGPWTGFTLVPGQAKEVFFSIPTVNFGNDEKFDLFVYVEGPAGVLSDEKYTDVLYVAPWTPPFAEFPDIGG